MADKYNAPLIFTSSPTVVFLFFFPEHFSSLLSIWLYAEHFSSLPKYFFFFAEHISSLDYVSRAHEIENLSVVRVAIIPEPFKHTPFKFQLWLTLGYIPRLFVFTFLKNNEFSNFS